MEFSAGWRNMLSAVTVIALLSLAQTARAQSAAPATPNEKEIRAATVLFYAAFNSALHGNLAPMSAVWSHRPDVTSLSAAGGHASTGARSTSAGEFAAPPSG